jgi:hypothetical protein
METSESVPPEFKNLWDYRDFIDPAVKQLDETEREVLKLRIIDKLDVDSIADKLGLETIGVVYLYDKAIRSVLATAIFLALKAGSKPKPPSPAPMSFHGLILPKPGEVSTLTLAEKLSIFPIKDETEYASNEIVNFITSNGSFFLTSPPTDERNQAGQLEHLYSLLSTLPATADVDGLKTLNATMGKVKQAFIPQLEMALNVTLKGTPKDTLEQKQALADFANETAAAYGMAVKHPTLGTPAILWADVGNWPGIGRFQIRAKDSAGKWHRASSDTLPELELVAVDPPAPILPPPETWQEIMARKAQENARKKGRNPAD